MYNREPSPNISRPIFYSAIVHILLIIIIAFAPSVKWPFADRPLQMVWVELPRGTSDDIGTGMKQSEALPKSTIQEQKQLLKEEKRPDENAMKEPEKKNEKKKEPKKEPPKKMSKESSALAKIDKILKNRTIQPEAAQIGTTAEGYKYGTSDQPLKVPVDDPEYVKYQAMIRAKIIQEWIVPGRYGEMAESERPRSRVIVMISENGEVVSTQWEKRSGDPSFDSSCIRAIQRASPFEIPTERLRWEAYNEGFLVEFDPRLKP